MHKNTEMAKEDQAHAIFVDIYHMPCYDFYIKNSSIDRMNVDQATRQTTQNEKHKRRKPVNPSAFRP